MATQYSVTNGPNKWDMMIALFEGREKKPQPVQFELTTTACVTSFNVEITLIEQNSSEENWRIEGVATPTGILQEGMIQRAVQIIYNSRSRKGQFQFLCATETEKTSDFELDEMWTKLQQKSLSELDEHEREFLLHWKPTCKAVPEAIRRVL